MIPLTPLEPWVARKISHPALHLDRITLEEYQLERLRQVIGLAEEKSSFYRRHLAGVDPARLRQFKDFEQVPFLTAEDLRTDGIQFLCVSQSEIARVVTLDTSGTSGNPKRCYFTRADQDLTIDFFGVGMTSLVDLGDRVLILLPGESAGSVGDLLHAGLQRRGITALKHGPVFDVNETLNRMALDQITALVGVPVQVLALARAWQRSRPAACDPPRAVLLTTDHVPAAITLALRCIWGCQVFNHYGMTEMGLGGGVSCAAQTGYHLREADFYFEIIDPATGRPVPNGESGEVVFTTLTRQGMPFIRYRTGDLSRFLPQPCPCGTQLRTLAFLRQRISGILPLGEGSFSLSDLDEALFPLDGLIDFQATFYPDSQPQLLSLEIFTFPGELPEDQILLDALGAIPVLQNAVQSGNLHLVIQKQDRFPPALGSMRKRTIAICQTGKIGANLGEC